MVTQMQEFWATMRRGLRSMGLNVRAPIELQVHIAKDDESGRWYVASSDVPGLRLEADDPLALIQRISLAAPELMALNEAEILERHRPRRGRKMAITPIFDSPLELAHA